MENTIKRLFRKIKIEEKLAKCNTNHFVHDYDSCTIDQGYSLVWQEDLSKIPDEYPEHDGFLDFKNCKSKNQVFEELLRMFKYNELEKNALHALSQTDKKGERFFEFRLFKFLPLHKMNQEVLELKKMIVELHDDLNNTHNYMRSFRYKLENLNERNAFFISETIRTDVNNYFRIQQEK